MDNTTEHEYKGYMSSESHNFFGCNVIYEEREGCGVVGAFIILAGGNIHLASKGDVFVKNEDGFINLKQ